MPRKARVILPGMPCYACIAEKHSSVCAYRIRGCLSRRLKKECIL